MAIADRIESMYDHVGEVYDTITNVELPEDKNIDNIPDTIKKSYLNIMNNGYEEIWDNWDKVTGSGTELSLDGTVEAPMGVEYKGNTSQNGTPTPDSPQDIHTISGDNTIKVTGKNLFSSGIEKGTLSTQGETSSSNNSIRSIDYIEVQPNTTYTISNNMSYHIYTYEYDTNKSFIKYVGGNTSDYVGTYTITATATTKYIKVRTNSTLTENNTECLWWINLGTTALPYEEYKGTSYPVNLGVNNLALTDNPSSPDANYISAGAGSQAIQYDITEQAFYTTTARARIFNLESGNTYTFSIDAKKRTAGSNFNIYLYYYNSDTSTSSALQKAFTLSSESYERFSWTFTIPSEYNALRIIVYNGDYFKNIQIEKGSIAHAYTENGKAIELNKIGDYKDKIFKNTPNTTDYDSNLEDNVWYVKKEIGKVIYTGASSEIWGDIENGGGGNKRIPKTLPYDSKAIDSLRGTLLSNYFKYNNSYATDTVGSAFTTYALNNSKLFVYPPASITTTADFKTWLSTHNTIVYYVLNTPTYTLIEDSTLISQLEALKSKTGQTNITQENYDLPFELDVEALKGDE